MAWGRVGPVSVGGQVSSPLSIFWEVGVKVMGMAIVLYVVKLKLPNDK